MNNIQIESATILRRYVVEQLGGQYQGGNKSSNQLKFMRSVFERVYPTQCSCPTFTYAPVQVRATDTAIGMASREPMDHLVRVASNLRRKWRTTQAVRIVVQEQNTIRQANAREIRKGDFVEVLATVDISERWRYNKKEVYVTWKPIHVVRLATAAIVRDVLPRVLPAEGMTEEPVAAGHETNEPRHLVRRVESMANELY